MYGPVGHTAGPSELPRTIPSAINDINASLSAIAATEQRLAVAFSRLVNPRPEGVGADSGARPTPDTVESRLNDSLRAAQQLAERLHALADRFEQAV